jgi:hypothetical protein
MIDTLMKDFNTYDIDKFANENPTRYENLCKIIGEFELGIRHLIVGVVLPYKDDRGCVSETVN